MPQSLLTDFPNGVASFGIPVLPLLTTGQVIFLSSVSGVNGNSGKSPANPVATLANAISLCNAANGDIIMAMAGHAESISSSTALTLSKSGITVLGLGYGALRPTFTLDTANTATINVTAANVRFVNCLFVANFLNIASLFTLTTAKSFQLIDCEIRDTSAILNFLRIIDTNTTTNDADGILMVRTKWYGLSATTATTVIKMDGTNNRMIIEDCYFAHANVDDGGLFMIIAAGKVLTNMEVKETGFNFVGVSSASAGVLITTNGSTNSGYFKRCYVQHLDTTSEIMVTASSGFVFWDLKASAVADKNPYLVPGADS